MGSQSRALIIEDNADLARLVEIHLQDIDVIADIANDGKSGVERFHQNHYELVILDIMLPELDGLEVCKRIRAANQAVPILMLTAKSEELDKVVGLGVGADDYLTKPFSIAEFTARIKALLRRANQIQSTDLDNPAVTQIKVGGLVIDTDKRNAFIDGELLVLTAKEFDLLSCFAHHPGRVYTREELLRQVWGYTNNVYQHTVNTHINRLRGKIEQDPAEPRYIVTVWGVGYKLAEH